MEEETKPHMVKQTITFSDGTETVFNYRGKIVDGVVIPDVPEEVTAPETIETVETVEAPVEIKEESAE